MSISSTTSDSAGAGPQGLPLYMLQPPLARLILKHRPELDISSTVSLDELGHFHRRWMELKFERAHKRIEGESQDPEDAARPDIPDIHADFGYKPSKGEQIADKMAKIGGSWGFVIFFAACLVAWMSVNSLHLLSKPFDPYPFILLNLALSTVSAIQAPLIMMSQNRQETMDRLRSENDFMINLRAEISLRSLHEKSDRMLAYEWQQQQSAPGGTSPAD